MSTTKRVSIHVASDDLTTRLPIFLESLASQTMTDWQAVIVDNSGNRSVPPEPPIYVLRNPRPQSLARSMSQAIELASGSEFYVLCRNDLVLAPTMLEMLLEEFQKDDSLIFAWPTFAKAVHDPESVDGGLLLGDDRVLAKRSEDFSAACVMVRANDVGSLRPDPRRNDDLAISDFIWRLAQTGAKGKHLPEAVAWLQPGVMLASPSLLRYWTWVWTRRTTRS